MRRRQRHLRAIVLVSLGLSFAVVGVIYFASSAPTHQTPAVVSNSSRPAPIPTVSYRGLPMTLKIPAINVDTSFEYMGLETNGDMAAPKSPSAVGWYKYGAIPGDKGSAVIDGHVVGSKGEPAVFARLDKLRKGDLIQVADGKNQTATFVVREIRTYTQQSQHSDVFTSASGTHLNIITCAGDWDSAQRHYLERLVVFADLSAT